MNTPRKYPMSIRYAVVEVAGTQVVITITDDLSDELLQQHFDKALDEEDYEYCQALRAEADKRNYKLESLNK